MAVSVNGGALEFSAVINAGQFNAAISAIEKQLAGLTKKAEDEAKGIDNLVKKTSLAIASYASIATAANFIGDIVRVRGEFQQLEVAFRTMLKSKSAADKLLAEATTLAAKTPFTLQEVGNSAKQLLAYGFAADGITKNIEMLGNVAAGVGAPLGDIVYLYGTLRTQGRAFQKDITQFTQRGIDIYGALQTSLGKSKDEITAMIEAGKIGFPEVEKAFKSLTNEGGLFFNLMQEQSKILTGLVSNLQDAWSRMLNDIGKSNEGVFAGAIKGAISVVDNYQDVLDIIKVLIATYGSYRAAIILTNTVTAISTSLTKGWTIAELLRFKAMQLSAAAMKILNATMLSNPAVAGATGIALLVSSFVFLRKETDNVKRSQQLLAEAQSNVGDRMAELRAKIQPYVESLKNANLSEKERVNIYEKLRAIDPDIVKGLDAKTLSYQTLAANVNVYLTKLREQYELEANREALTASIKQENEIRKKLKRAEDLKKRLGTLTGNDLFAAGQGSGAIATNINANANEVKQLTKELAEQQKVSEELGQTQVKAETKTQEAKQRTLAVIEDEIKAEKEKQTQYSTSSKEFLKFQQKINALEAEKKRITGDKKLIKQIESEYNKRLEALKQLLQDISNAESDARQSGMLKEQSEIDKINERYNELKKRAAELKAGEGVLQRIERARVQQVGNVKEKEAFELYKKSLQDQKALFDQFEEYKVTLGEEKSRELLGFQKGDAVDYIAFLRSEILKIYRSGGSQSLSGKLKIQLLTDQVVEAEKKQAQQMIDDQAKAYEEMINATISVEDQKAKIIDKYTKLQKTLADDKTVANKEQRAAMLTQAMEEELAQLQDYANRQTDVFKKLNQDLLFVTRDGLKKRRDEIKKILDENTSLTPALRQALEQALEQIDQLLKSSGELFGLTLKELQELERYADIAQQTFSQLSSAFAGLNDDLSASLDTLSDMAGVFKGIAQTAAGIASGNIGGIVSGVVGIVTGIINIVKKVKQSVAEAKREIEAFQTAMYNGELEINRLYRDRARQQAAINQLKLQGLQSETKLLKEQKAQIDSQFKSTLALLQQQTAVVGKETEKYGGFLGIGRKTRAVNIVQTLAGKSYDDLEKLFLKGQLEGKAKELFEQLQKIKQEGIDVDALLQQNAEEAKQIFTGTTADSITDSIVDGFKNGKRSATDFADTFEDLMRNAVLNALKFQALEGPLKEFYEQFAAFSQSDGVLTQQEIEQLRNNFAGIIKNAGNQFDQLQQITNVDFSNGSAGGNSLTGAIKGITETQANLLAGQFGGLRLTAMDILSIGKTQLEIQNKIQMNTALSAERMAVVIERMTYYYETVGIKIK